MRFPIRDFDPFDLRRRLPKAVARLAAAHSPRHGVAYIHCTAGLGRAPATALAYMNWLRGWDLNEAHAHLTAARRCSPRLEAVRAATADLLSGAGPVPVTVSLHRRGTAKKVQVAGLDIGWHQAVDLEENPVTRRLEVRRGFYLVLLLARCCWRCVLSRALCSVLDAVVAVAVRAVL